MDEDPGPSRRTALIAMLVLAVLAVGGWLLSQKLHEASRAEDCLMQGRRNCAPVR